MKLSVQEELDTSLLGTSGLHVNQNLWSKKNVCQAKYKMLRYLLSNWDERISIIQSFWVS